MGTVQAWIEPGTSPVDWCEDNYTVTPYIAEFFNTISNLLFIFIPTLSSYFWRTYHAHVSNGIYLVWGLFTVVGLSSAYFHATLSLLGQLLDELSILWVLMLSYSLFTPSKYVLKLSINPRVFKTLVGCLAVVITLSAFLKPVINAYALFVVGGPAIYMLVSEVRQCEEANVRDLGRRTLISLVLASLAWVFDKFLCFVWKALRIPVLHGLWHVLIFITAYGMEVLFCYFHAAQDVPHIDPVIKFYPRSYGLPYVHCSVRHIKAP